MRYFEYCLKAEISENKKAEKYKKLGKCYTEIVYFILYIPD